MIPFDHFVQKYELFNLGCPNGLDKVTLRKGSFASNFLSNLGKGSKYILCLSFLGACGPYRREQRASELELGMCRAAYTCTARACCTFFLEYELYSSEHI